MHKGGREREICSLPWIPARENSRWGDGFLFTWRTRRQETKTPLGSARWRWVALADHLDTNANMFAVRGAASHLHHVRLWECNSPDTSSHVQQTVDCVCVWTVRVHMGMIVERMCVIWFVLECFRSHCCVVLQLLLLSLAVGKLENRGTRRESLCCDGHREREREKLYGNIVRQKR